MDLIKQLNWRYAVKKMNGEQPDAEKIQTLFEAIRLTASSYGFQPYKLVVVSDQKLKNKLMPASFDQEKVPMASHMLVLAIKTNTDEEMVNNFVKQNAKIRNEPEDSFSGLKHKIVKKLDKYSKQGTLDSWKAKQAYIALGNVLTSAAVLGIDACPMEGFEPEKYDKILGLTEKHLSAAVVCAIGVRSEEDDYQLKKKVRWDAEDFFVYL